jgi:paraquat-inducible protein B
LPPARAGHRFKLILVWLVPVVAALIGGWLAVRALWLRGPTVQITFATAEGLQANRTTIQYRSVEIGLVRSIDLLDDRTGVVVTAELSRRAERLLVDDARFWVVRPRVSTAGVSGIGTLFTGAHIDFDPGVARTPRRTFVGLEAPPSTVAGRRGHRFLLRGDDIGSLEIGSPIYLRRLQVGQVTRVGLADDGAAVTVEVFVDAPYHRQVTRSTRFWNASGVDLTVGPRGIKLDTQSLASVLMGGIALETPADGEPAAAAGATFLLFTGREAAMRSLGARTFQVVFSQPVHGLAAGAPVDLLGQEIGQVSRVSVDFDPVTVDPRTVVTLSIQADRLRTRGALATDVEPLLDRLIQRGLRAQLRAENLLTGQRIVAFDLVAAAPRARIDWSRQPVELPTYAGPADDLPTVVRRLASKLERVPVEDLAREGTLAARQMRRTLEDTSRLVTEIRPQVTAVLGKADRTLDSVDGAFSSDAPLQRDLRQSLRDVSGAGYALRSLAEYLERHPEALLRGKKEDRP